MNIHSAVPMTRPEPRSAPVSAPAAATVDKRQAILDAALALFAERGFHGTAVPLVADKAGVGAGTLYRYFESKEALVNALYRQCKGALAHALLDGFPLDAPVRAQFGECWQRMSRFAVQSARAFAFLELHHHGKYIDAESRAMDDAVLGPIRAFVLQAQAAEQVKALPPEVLIAVVYGALVGVVRASEAGYITPARFEESLRLAEICAWEAIRR